jgi:hypothetical protein
VSKSKTTSLSTDFSDTFPSPVCPSLEIRSGRWLAYLAGKGSHLIRRTMVQKDRRIRWLSASSSQ